MVMDLVPPGELELDPAEVCEVSSRDLAWRREFLERLAAAAVAGGDVHGTLAAALAVLTAEQEHRASAYANSPDKPFACSCGFRCTGLAGMDAHLDGFWDDDGHDEIRATVADRDGSPPGAAKADAGDPPATTAEGHAEGAAR